MGAIGAMGSKPGAIRALGSGVGVRRFEDLIAWQLAHELQEEIFAFTSRAPVNKDVNFCNQIRDSSRSAVRNIAEGFGRYYAKEFARFLRIAIGSLHETKSHLLDGKDRRYLSDSEHVRLLRLTLRALKASSRLLAYLRRSKSPEPFTRTP